LIDGRGQRPYNRPVPYLKLVETASQRVFEIREDVAQLGRDPGIAVSFTGEAAKVVSVRHAELRQSRGLWHVTDLASRNGTFVNGERLSGTLPLKPGDTIRLGERGPALTVAATAEAMDATFPEHAVYTGPGPAATPDRPADARAYGVTLLAAGSGRRFEARGRRIRLGRGRECEVRPVESSDRVVSRVHAELMVGSGGGLSLRDVESRNGTYLNGERVSSDVPIRIGDKIMLGDGGPVLIVEGLGTLPSMPAAAPAKRSGVGQQTVVRLIGQALADAKEARRQGGRGSTAFVRAIADQVGQSSGRKIRWLATTIVVLVLLLAGAVWGVYRLLSTQVAQTEQAFRTSEDSARAEVERLRRELTEARAAAAPVSQVDSLRQQLESAQRVTRELGAALDRAQTALSQQLAAGEAHRVEAQRDVERLRGELAAAERRAPTPALIDSLRRAVTTAEANATNLEAKLRAVRGVDFASVAQQTQGAVGLITVRMGREYFDGTGFVVSSDGYLLTNWHVVADSLRAEPDTIWVTMADQSVARFADVVATSKERDLAVLKVRGYQGPHLATIDWKGTQARQGEPAALIGFPAGSGFARDRGSIVRTSMTAGILSRVTTDLVQFDGMTIGGSSGSPVVNADGAVISVHRAGLKQGPGFALSVPVRFAIPLLPAALRERLGLVLEPAPPD
jgi:pSer/pThr/pTyr-binding forkhead associated (FHA) protein/S1-C subfamily serine protease